MHNIKKLFNYQEPLIAAATIIFICGLIVTLIASYTAYRIKNAADTVSVTGSARQSVTADFARWVINLDTSTPVGGQQAGYDRLAAATTRITQYLKDQGFSDVEIPSPGVNANYAYPQNAAPMLTGYTVSRQIIVRSDDIEKMTALADRIGPLSGTGYNVSTQGLELTYRKLDDMRVTLLANAIKDAQARAQAIAKESGRSVGTLRSAASGVVQVLPQGGVDISDYGTYDTQSKQKEVMVTVRATFSLR